MLGAIQGGKGISAVDGMNHLLMQLCSDVIFFLRQREMKRGDRGVDELATENG